MTKEEAKKLKGQDLVRVDRLEGPMKENCPGLLGKVFKTGAIPADEDFVYIMEQDPMECWHCHRLPVQWVSLADKEMVAPQEELNCNYCKNFSFLGGICTKRCAGFSKECFEE